MKRLRILCVGLLVGLAPIMARAGGDVTYFVTNSLDSGPGSLRAAVSNALKTVIGDNVFIAFQIPTGGVVHTINLLSALPPITNTMHFNGTTQAGYSNTPLIKIVAGATNLLHGLRLQASACSVRALCLTSFKDAGIEIAVQGNSTVAGCHIISNGYYGVVITGVSGNTIGGNSTNDANVIGGNLYGVEITGANANNNLVAGNYIGVQPAGAGVINLSNKFTGVTIYVGASNIIRGSSSARQIISGNGQRGIEISVFAHQNRVEGNYIGTDLAGTGAMDNGFGVYITSSNNIVGGTAVSNRNVISGNSIGVYMSGSEATGNRIAGNYICVNAAGTAPVPGSGAVRIENCSSNIVSGTAAAPQIIAGSQGAAIFVIGPGADGNIMAGNTIGIGATGLVITNNNNITLFGANNNRIGGPAATDRNIIAGSQSSGVDISNSSSNNVVQGNYIGLDAGGVARPNNAYGVSIGDGTGNLIGGNNPGVRNIISGNKLGGVYISAVSNRVQGNFIGTGISGTSALANGAHGVIIDSGQYNVIGGSSPNEGNLISGNATNGIFVNGISAQRNIISANFIGTDASGALGLSNRNSGVVFNNAQNNTVGGVTPGERNIISGNANNGVEIDGTTATGNVVRGNFIGVASNGVSRLGNGLGGGFGAGIYFGVLAHGHTIGGAAPEARNIIAANTYGLVMQVANFNLIQGNFIGLDNSGAAESNRFDGIYVEVGHSNRIVNNVISANGAHGIRLFGGATGNIIQRNRIGLAPDSNVGIGNAASGVFLDSNAVLVGGTNAADGNVIAFNGGAAVTATNEGVGRTILGNLIYSNAFGIDLGGDGPTPNDPAPDADAGDNDLQNFPVITNAVQGSTIVQGRLVSNSNQAYRCEFFAVNVPQGMIFLGATNITTPASGTNNFTNVIVPGTAPTGAMIIATATDTNGNTSEFSAPIGVKAAVDADGDGMWDAWEQANFGNTTNFGSGNNDGDAFNNYQEFVADTSPTNANSFFRFVSITNALPHYPGWVSSPARWYDVEYSANLLSPAWSNVAANIVGAGGVQSVADGADQTNRAYRVRAKLP